MIKYEELQNLIKLVDSPTRENLDQLKLYLIDTYRLGLIKKLSLILLYTVKNENLRKEYLKEITRRIIYEFNFDHIETFDKFINSTYNRILIISEQYSTLELTAYKNEISQLTTVVKNQFIKPYSEGGLNFKI